jgi:hypothetical protein
MKDVLESGLHVFSRYILCDFIGVLAEIPGVARDSR